MSSWAKDPSNLFGYRRLVYEKDVQYDEFMPSEESEVDTNKAAKVPGSSTTNTQTLAKGPTWNTATLLIPSVTTGLFVAAPTASKTTAKPVGPPRPSVRTTAPQTTVSSAKTSSTSASAKAPPKVAKGSPVKGTLAKAMSTSGIVHLASASGSTLESLVHRNQAIARQAKQLRSEQERNRTRMPSQMKKSWKAMLCNVKKQLNVASVNACRKSCERF